MLQKITDFWKISNTLPLNKWNHCLFFLITFEFGWGKKKVLSYDVFQNCMQLHTHTHTQKNRLHYDPYNLNQMHNNNTWVKRIEWKLSEKNMTKLEITFLPWSENIIINRYINAVLLWAIYIISKE